MGFVFEFIVQFLIEVICGMTGHLVLWVFTLGKWKLFEKDEFYIADIVGILFWVAIGIGIWLIFFR